MSKYLISIHADGNIVSNEYDDTEEFELEDFQDFVGGYIEVAPTCFGNKVLMLVNETGKLDELPYNKNASVIQHYTRYDLILGDVVLVKVNGEEFTGFSEEEKDKILNYMEWMDE